MYDLIVKIVQKIKQLPDAVRAFKETIPEEGVNAEYVDNAIDEAVNGLASETYVDNAVNGLASETYVDNAVNGLASETYVDTAVGNVFPSSQGTPPNNTVNDNTLFGTYFGSDNSITGLPTSNTSTYYQMFLNKKVQIAIQYSSSGAVGFYVRYYINDQWYAWKNLAMKSDLNSYVPTSNIYHGLDTTQTQLVLGADQGRALNNKITALKVTAMQMLEVATSVAPNASASKALPSGYTYTNTRVISCYLFINGNTQFGQGFVSWNITSDNKLQVTNNGGGTGAIQALIAKI